MTKILLATLAVLILSSSAQAMDMDEVYENQLMFNTQPIKDWLIMELQPSQCYSIERQRFEVCKPQEN